MQSTEALDVADFEFLMPSKWHKTYAFRIFGSFLNLFGWFKMVDPLIQGHRRHLYTLFHQNPSGMGGCRAQTHWM